MSFFKILNLHSIKIYILSLLTFVFLQSCSSFYYRTYPENEKAEDPEPDYTITLNPAFQEYVSFMFIGNRIENFGTYFNTFFNAEDNYSDAYDDYTTKVLATYSERLDSIYFSPALTQESIDLFNKAIEKASRVLQYHKSSAFMDRAVLLIGKSYFFMGDYLKAERKFGEFISKLSTSPLEEEAVLYLAKTQLRLNNSATALDRLNALIANSKDKSVVAQSYQALAEYYIHIKDYETSVKYYRKSIEFSGDKSFKAQMQFLVASLIAKTDPKQAAVEFNKVLDYSASYDLEYLTRLNYAKNLIMSNNFTEAASVLDKLEVKYKDSPDYLAEINFLKAKYYDQKGDFKTAMDRYLYVIQNYPKTVSSSDASFALANYYENTLGDYLTAYRFYKLSTEQSSAGHNYSNAANKLKIYKRYFDLRSTIAGATINTDYDSAFINKTQPVNKGTEEQIKGGQEPKQGEEQHQGKGGGFSNLRSSFFPAGNDSLQNEVKGTSRDTSKHVIKDTLKNISKDTLKDTTKQSNIQPVDSTKIKEDLALKAKFELAELFIYDLNKPDSAEYYLLDAFKQSEDYDFQSKVLFTLASLYKNTNQTSKSDEILKKIVKEYPNSAIANECRKMLNLPVVEENISDPADSLYYDAENKFNSSRYDEALNTFKDIIFNYPSSKHLHRSVYAAGWIYENILSTHDSAFVYYSKIVKDDPNSDYSKMVAGKVSEYESFKTSKTDSTAIKNDSLSNIKDTTSIKTDSLSQTDTLSSKQEINPITPEIGPGKNGSDNNDPTKQGNDMKKEDEENKNQDPTK